MGRGFAFIVFKEVSGLVAASAQEAHVIKGKRATCKKAEARQGKIYVGKLPVDEISNQDLSDHFSQFGSVVEVIRPVDKLRDDAPKNFCFISFPGYGAYPTGGYAGPYAYGSYSYGAPDYGTAQAGYFTSGYDGRPSPGKMMRGRGARGRPY